jgi:zinc protease
MNQPARPVRGRSPLLLTLVLLWPLLAPAARAEVSAAARPGPPETFRLANGLEVILREDHHLPVVTVALRYDVGSMDDPPERSGTAHLVEHLMFTASSHMQHAPPWLLYRIGGTQVNASTAPDHTLFHETVPSFNLELALWVESDRMGYLAPELDAERLDAARKIVENERRQRIDTRPYAAALERLQEAMFPPAHPLRVLYGEGPEDLGRIGLADVRAFHRRHYGPNRATLALVGDLAPAQARRLVERYFGTLPPVPPADRRPPPPAALQREIVLHHQDPLAHSARVVLAWHAPAAGAPAEATGAVVMHLLGGGRTGLLGRLMAPGGPAAGLSIEASPRPVQSTFRITAVPRDGVPGAQLVREIDAVLDELRRDGVDPERLGHARAFARTAALGADTEGLDRAARLLSERHQLGRPQSLEDRLARYERVTPPEAERFLREVLRPDRRAVLHVAPLPLVARARGTRP